MGGAPALDGHTEVDEELFLTVLGDAIEAVERREIPYVLMGGVGSATLGRPRSTHDIDLFVRPEDARPTLDALSSSGFTVDETDPNWLFKAFEHDVLVDVIFRSARDIYLDDDMLEHSRLAEYKGRLARVIGPEDLLVIKAVVAAEHVPHHWYDALAIVSGSDLDWDYLLMRALRHGPRRVLSLLLYAESNDLAVPADRVKALFHAVHQD